MTRLTARGVSRSFGGVRAVADVDLAVPAGRVTALAGPNGAGKSTLFGCLSGTLRPDAGRILLGGRDVTRLPAHARARRGLGRTFQQVAVFPRLSVADNVRVGAEQRAGLTAGRLARGLAGLPAPDRRRHEFQVAFLLGLLELEEVRDLPAADLPAGTLRRVELGRVLAAGPEVLLLDEPAAGLDGTETAALAALLRALADGGMALLLVEHDAELVSGLADRLYVMEAGRVRTRTAR